MKAPDSDAQGESDLESDPERATESSNETNTEVEEAAVIGDSATTEEIAAEPSATAGEAESAAANAAEPAETEGTEPAEVEAEAAIEAEVEAETEVEAEAETEVEVEPAAEPAEAQATVAKEPVQEQPVEEPGTDPAAAEVAAEPAAADVFATLAKPLRRALEGRGYHQATAVQRAVLESEVQGRDVQISSQTGSGKTVALGMLMAPVLLNDEEYHGGTQAMIIAPTRELAVQVCEELAWLFSKVSGLRVESFTGGTDIRRDLRRLNRPPQVVVGTPGRLLDHLRNGALDGSGITQLVLDEADQMLDMGFREELEAILETTPKERTTHLVSATFPAAIRRLAERYQRDPMHIEGTRLGEAHEDIAHIAHVIYERDRYPALVNLLLMTGSQRTLVFVKTRIDAAQVAERLAKDGFSALAISGDLQQAQRTRTLAAFRAGMISVLVATDVAARGLDIPDVAMVIHGDLPFDGESYTHRSGRTGRAGSKGRSVLLVPVHQVRRARRLLFEARVDAGWSELPSAAKISKKIIKRARRGLYHALIDDSPTPTEHLAYAQRLIEDNDPARVVAVLLSRQPGPPREPFELRVPEMRSTSWEDRGRGSGGGPRGRGPRGSGPRPRSGFGGPRGGFGGPRGGFSGPRGGPRMPRSGAPGGRRSGDFTSFSINWGYSNGANAKRLLALLCRRGGISGREVGMIDSKARSSSFEISARVAGEFESNFRRPDDRDPGFEIRRGK